MKPDRDDEERLADRLVNYADALAALAFVGVSGLGLAVADPETRESVARGYNYVAAGNVLFGVVLTALILVLRRWERDLRGSLSPKAARYNDYLHWARLAVVWFSTIQAVVLMVVIA